MRAGAETTGGPEGRQTKAGSSSGPAARAPAERPRLASDPPDPRLTERRNPATRHIDRASPREIVRLLLAEEARVPAAVEGEAAAIAALVEEVAERLRRGGRLVYVGAGTSGRLGAIDAAECPPTFGTDPGLVRAIVAGGTPALWRAREGAEDDRGEARRAVRRLAVGPADFVLGIATSGSTPFVHAALEEARRLGAGIGFLSCTEPPTRVRELADIVVTPLVGPEAIAGSTRLKAGTATKLVLNALTTGAMIRLGKVHGNLMVDLRATSEKLAGRAIRIVQAACGVGEAEARGLLAAAGGSAKTAIAARELRTPRAMAERALDACAGSLAAALERFPAGEGLSYYQVYPAAADPEGIGALRVRLEGGPERVTAALRARGRGRRPGRWTAAQHVAHLIQFETEAVQPRLKAMREGGKPRLEEWEASPRPPLGRRAARRLVERFRRERQRTLRIVTEAGAPLWERSGRVGAERLTPYRLLRATAQHDEAHATRIRERVHPALLGTERARARDRVEEGG